MRRQFTLLDGEPVSVDAPEVSLAPPVAVGVLYADATEIEVNAGPQASADLFLEATGTALSAALTLRGGRTLRVGPLGGDRSNGWGFVVEIGDQRLFGPTAPAVSVERLAAVLSAASPGRNARGAVLKPKGQVRWSPYRTQGASLVATLGGGDEMVLDVRRTVPGKKRGRNGLKVRGGQLTRRTEQGRDHAVLEGDDFVTYGLPAPGTSLDDLASAMAALLVTRA